MGSGEAETDVPAHGVAAEVGALQAQLLHPGHDTIHRALEREAMLGPAAAEAAEVRRIDPALFSQWPNVAAPPATRSAVAMDQDKRRPFTCCAVVQACGPDAR